MQRTIAPLEQCFWDRVDRRGPDECWPWVGARRPDGYGQLSTGHRGPSLRAHRISWQIANGSDPGGLHVCHKCDNPECVNPAHLWLGTARDNMRDMATKGRHRNQAKTHCRRGHELIGQNIIPDAKGYRRCAVCRRAYMKEWKAAR